MIKGQLKVCTIYGRKYSSETKHRLQDSSRFSVGLTKSEMQEVARRFNLFNELINTLSANSPYGDKTYLPKLDCTVGDLRERLDG